jgi:hypothetical protein
MDDLFLKPHELAARDRKKEQKIIFEKSIDSQHHLKVSFNDAISEFACSFYRSLSHSNSIRFKKRSSIPLSEPEANIQGFRRKTPRPLK